jgi:hypothetical protein
MIRKDQRRNIGGPKQKRKKKIKIWKDFDSNVFYLKKIKTYISGILFYSSYRVEQNSENEI